MNEAKLLQLPAEFCSGNNWSSYSIAELFGFSGVVEFLKSVIIQELQDFMLCEGAVHSANCRNNNFKRLSSIQRSAYSLGVFCVVSAKNHRNAAVPAAQKRTIAQNLFNSFGLVVVRLKWTGMQLEFTLIMKPFVFLQIISKVCHEEPFPVFLLNQFLLFWTRMK